MVCVWLTLSYLTWLFIDFSWFVETLGFLAVFIEACLGTPQFLKNYQNKSTVGMSGKSWFTQYLGCPRGSFLAIISGKVREDVLFFAC